MVGRRHRSLEQSVNCNDGCMVLELDPREIDLVQLHPEVSISKIFVTRSGQHNNCPCQDNSRPLFSRTRTRHHSRILTCLHRRSANRAFRFGWFVFSKPSLLTSEYGRSSQSRVSSKRNTLHVCKLSEWTTIPWPNQNPQPEQSERLMRVAF